MSLEHLPALRDVPAVSAAQMAEIDRIATEDLGLSLEMLMENASRAVARAAFTLLGGVAAKRIVALAGSGNNGGDALGAARHLAGWGADARAVLAVPVDRLHQAPRLQLELLRRLDVPVTEAAEAGAVVMSAAIPDADLIVDGLLGYSVSGAPRGAVAEHIRAANRSGLPILAVDLPSGLHPDSGAPLGLAVRAAATVTLALPKTGLLAPNARGLVGELLLADIGIPAAAFARVGIDTRGVFVDGDLIRILR